MDPQEAVAFAFESGLKVRGQGALQAARVSLGLHASRTADPAPFLGRDGALGSRSREALEAAGRGDLALKVALWESDAAEQPASARAPSGAVRAYGSAKSWAASAEGRAGLGWLRDVPRAVAEREVLAERLLFLAEAGRGPAGRLAEAALEAALAEHPRPAVFSTLVRAATVAASVGAVDRTIEGLASLDPASESPHSRALLAKLRAALSVVRTAAAGRPLEEAVDGLVEARSRGLGPSADALFAHLAAATARGGHPERAAEILEMAIAPGAAPPPPGARVALLFVRRALKGAPEDDPLRLPAATRPAASELVEGACEAARALRSAAPVLHTIKLFDPEEFGVALGDPGAIELVKELMREGARAAAAAGELESLRALFDRLRRLGLRPQWDEFLRALLADGAAHAAARRRSGEAWTLAMEVTSRGVPRFERAKMAGRAACEFIRASQAPDLPPSWADPYFPSSPTAAGSKSSGSAQI